VADLLGPRAARPWVDAFADSADAHWQELGELDRQSGDGDFGANLQATVGRIRGSIGAGDGSVAGVFDCVSKAFMNAGGTSGPLFGIWFAHLSRVAADPPGIGLAELARGTGGGLEVVQRLGGAKVGDKTMVDALEPAAHALDAAASSGDDLAQGLASAARAARDGADSTASLLARRGRASYVGEVARGVLDPGAVAVALFFEAALGLGQEGAFDVA
jgi:dihydroxyacetone kinase-like protein